MYQALLLPVVAPRLLETSLVLRDVATVLKERLGAWRQQRCWLANPVGVVRCKVTPLLSCSSDNPTRGHRATATYDRGRPGAVRTHFLQIVPLQPSFPASVWVGQVDSGHNPNFLCVLRGDPSPIYRESDQTGNQQGTQDDLPLSRLPKTGNAPPIHGTGLPILES